MNDVSKPKFEAPPTIIAKKPLPVINNNAVPSPYNTSKTVGAQTGTKTGIPGAGGA